MRGKCTRVNQHADMDAMPRGILGTRFVQGFYAPSYDDVPDTFLMNDAKDV